MRNSKREGERALLCDADGTLLQSWDWIIEAVYHSLEQFGVFVPEGTVEFHFVRGISLRDFYRITVSHLDIEECIRVHQRYQADHMDLITLFPGVAETLRKIRGTGMKLGIVTSRKTKAPLLATLRQFDIDFFDAIVTLEDVVSSKPDPEGVMLAMRKLRVEPHLTFFMGDTRADVDAGKGAGVVTIGALYGFGRELLREAGADWYVEQFSDVLNIVCPS